jgi:hypothetical protein
LLKGVIGYKKNIGLRLDFFKIFLFGLGIIGASIFARSWGLAGIGAVVLIIGYAQKDKWQELAKIRQDYSLFKNYDRKKMLLILFGLGLLFGLVMIILNYYFKIQF